MTSWNCFILQLFVTLIGPSLRGTM